MTFVAPGLEVFFDRRGEPLENGFIYVGEADMDARANPIQVYWDEDLSVPAAQPIRTLGGYPVYQGAPSALYINATGCSITVLDKDMNAVLVNYPGSFGSDELTFIASGAGAVPRTLLDKARDMVSIRDFGAVGDGVTDDTDAINAALAGGDVDLYFNPGEYVYTAPLRVYSNTTITMHPDCVLLDQTVGSGGSYGFLNGELGNTTYASGYDGEGNITIRGGQMDGAARLAASVSSNPICFAHGRNILIEGVRFRNNYKSHFIEINACQHVKIIRNFFDDLDPADTPHSRECINIDYAYAGGLPAFGSYDDTVCDDVLIWGNTARNGDVFVGSHAAPAGAEPNHTRIKVLHNYVNTMISAGIAPQYWSDSLIDYNDLIDCGVRILRGWGLTDSEIKGNRIRGGGTTACITIDNSDGREPDSIKVTDNWVWDVGGAAIFAGDSTNIQVMGNHIFGAGSEGIYFDPTVVGGEIGNNFIHGANQAGATYSAIRVAGDDVTVHDNHIDHGGYATQYNWAIEVNASAGNCRIDNNIYEDGATAGLMVNNTVARVDGQWCAELDDDTAVAIPFPARYLQGLVLFAGHSDLASSIRGLFWARCDNTTPVMAEVAAITAADTALTTGVLTGTTGTDGDVTFSAADDGNVYIENRRGILFRFTLLFVGH